MKINEKIMIPIVLGIIVICNVILFVRNKTIHHDFEIDQLKEYELKNLFAYVRIIYFISM